MDLLPSPRGGDRPDGGCPRKKLLVRHWLHTGFLNVMSEKMAKSLGNFTTIRDML